MTAAFTDEYTAPAGGLLDHLNTTADELEEPAPRALPGQLYDVELEDGSTFRVRMTNRDRVAWDMTASKRRWPSFTDAPFLATTFVVWNAAKRAGLTALAFEAFMDAAADITPVSAREDGGFTDPTRPDQPPTSS